MPKKYYNRTNTCDICGINFDVPSSKPHREYNKEGNWTGRWLCKMCWYHNDYKMRPNEIARRRDISSVADHRTGNYYNRTNTCDICGINFDVSSGNPHREYNKEGNWTGRWLCIMCWYHRDYKMRPNEIARRRDISSVADHRTGNLDPNSSQAKGGLFEELTCIWRSTVSTIPVENLNEKLDCYNTPIDHSRDSELGILQTKGCLYSYLERKWYQNFKNEHNHIIKGFKFDHLILYCASKDGKIIERIYIFPIEEILEISSISITKNPTDRWGNPITPWYEQYRIKDEKIINKVNEIWQKIIQM